MIAEPPARIGKTTVNTVKGKTVPSVSKAQQGAMFAAASGHSKIGIPRKVAREYVAADKARGPTKLPARKKPQPHKSLLNG